MQVAGFFDARMDYLHSAYNQVKAGLDMTWGQWKALKNADKLLLRTSAWLRLILPLIEKHANRESCKDHIQKLNTLIEQLPLCLKQLERAPAKGGNWLTKSVRWVKRATWTVFNGKTVESEAEKLLAATLERLLLICAAILAETD